MPRYVQTDDLNKIVLVHHCSCQLLLSGESNNRSLDLATRPNGPERHLESQTMRHCVRVTLFLFSHARLKSISGRSPVMTQSHLRVISEHYSHPGQTYSVMAPCSSSISPNFPAHDLDPYHPTPAVFLIDSRLVGPQTTPASTRSPLVITHIVPQHHSTLIG